MIFLSVYLFMLAAACNAVMDTLAHHHFKSIFKKHITGFWSDSATTSWKLKYVDWDAGDKRRVAWIFGLNKPLILCDAWHMFKSLMVILICAAIVVAIYAIEGRYGLQRWGYLSFFICYGAGWNTTFSFFYNYLLISRASRTK